MKRDELPVDTEARLSELVGLLERALNTATTPHTQAVSVSSMPDGPAGDSMDGGALTAPGKPPIPHDRKALTAAHKALLRSGEGVLYGVVLRARRTDAGTPWDVRVVLVARNDHDRLVERRRALDKEVEKELSAIAGSLKGLDWLSFGRETTRPEPEVAYRDASGVQRAQPSKKLLELLQKTDELYSAAGLHLRRALWSWNEGGVRFQEYFE